MNLIVDPKDERLKLDPDMAPEQRDLFYDSLRAALERIAALEKVAEFLSRNSVEIVPRKDGSVELYVDGGDPAHIHAPTLEEAVKAALKEVEE